MLEISRRKICRKVTYTYSSSFVILLFLRSPCNVLKIDPWRWLRWRRYLTPDLVRLRLRARILKFFEIFWIFWDKSRNEGHFHLLRTFKSLSLARIKELNNFHRLKVAKLELDAERSAFLWLIFKSIKYH